MSSTLFSPPAPTVAIEIASHRVTVVEVTGGAKPVVSACASELLGDGVVTPSLAGVNIADPKAVADALRRALDRAGLRATRRAALVIPDNVARVSLLAFEQLPSKAADVEQLIRWQLRKAMPFPIEEAQVSHFLVHSESTSRTVAAVVARRDVVAEHEAVATAAGIHAGIVDLASFNIMNAVIGATTQGDSDALLVCLAEEATTLAILRGPDLMFYRHRAAVDEEPLSALVHQTAMYHEDRLGGARFARVWLAGAALAGGADHARKEIADRLGLSAEPVDVRAAAALQERISATPDVLDALAAPVGVLLRNRSAA